METVNVGIIGAGFIGQVAHIANYAEIEGCRIVALAELRPELRYRVSERYNILRSYPTHMELLDDREVDAVVVVTPRHMTGPIAFDCLKAGKHLITEKPMAGTVEQAEKLVRVANEMEVCYAVGYMRRHDEGVEKAKKMLDELIETNELGQIIYARAHCFGGEDYCNIDGHVTTNEKIPEDRHGWPIAPSWLPEKYHSDYAWFLNVYCHNVNLLRFLLGRTPAVDYARFDRRNGRVAIFNFGDYEGILETGNFTYYSWDEVTEIYFTHGRLRIVTPPAFLRNVPAQIELYKGNDVHSVNIHHNGWTWAFRRQAEAFIRCVRERSEPVANGADGLEDLRLIEEMWQVDINRREISQNVSKT